jgi:hypothetical protein
MQMKAFVRIALASAAMLVAAGPAAADTLDVLMKNTLKMTDSRGGVTTIWLSPVSRMKQADPSGMMADGFWAFENRGLCWTARGKSQICVPMETSRDVGAAWEVMGPTGKVVAQLAIIEGREGEPTADTEKAE